MVMVNNNNISSKIFTNSNHSAKDLNKIDCISTSIIFLCILIKIEIEIRIRIRISSLNRSITNRNRKIKS